VSGSVHNIRFFNFLPAYAAGNMCDLIVGQGNKIYNVEISNNYINECHNFVQLGYPEGWGKSPTIDEFFNINIFNNVINEGSGRIWFKDNVRNVQIKNHINNTNSPDYEIDPAKQLFNVYYNDISLDQNN